MANTTDELKSSMDQLINVVDQAVSTGDFSHMSSDLGRIVKDVSDIGSDAIRQMSTSKTTYHYKHTDSSGKVDYRNVTVRENNQPTSYQRGTYINPKRQREAELMPYFMPEANTMGSKILSIVSAAGGVILGASAVGLGIGAAVTGLFGLGLSTAITGALTASCFILARQSGKSVRLMGHYNQYRRLLSDRLYMDVKEIAQKTYLSESQVVQELEDLTKKGMFRQGHFDVNKKSFIASDEIYSQYLETARVNQLRLAEQKRMEEVKRQEEAKTKALSEEVQLLLAQGEDYINAIHAANERIPGEQVSGKLNRMEQIVRRIFAELKERPELADRLSMFMDYYLPTTKKLVEAYAQMDQESLAGGNISNAKKEIEDSLDTINDAFENLLDSFFKEQAVDVSSDISVMKTMLKQDGLTTDNTFKEERL